MSPLFREEALQHRARRLEGEIALSTSRIIKVLTVVLGFLLTAFALSILVIEWRVTVPVTGWVSLAAAPMEPLGAETRLPPCMGDAAQPSDLEQVSRSSPRLTLLVPQPQAAQISNDALVLFDVASSPSSSGRSLRARISGSRDGSRGPTESIGKNIDGKCLLEAWIEGEPLALHPGAEVTGAVVLPRQTIASRLLGRAAP